jgi:hypothetical protein
MPSGHRDTALKQKISLGAIEHSVTGGLGVKELSFDTILVGVNGYARDGRGLMPEIGVGPVRAGPWWFDKPNLGAEFFPAI